MPPPCAWASRAALGAIGVLLLGPVVARAAELQLRAECRCRKPVVTLGDVADVLAADPQEADALAAIELFPSPPPGGKRFLGVRKVQDLLIARGINLLEHRLSGSSQVAVFGPGEETQTVADDPLSASLVQKAERRVRDAVVRYLREHVSEGEPWTAHVQLDDSQARLVASAGSEISVRGGAAPWWGPQRFEVTVKSADGPKRFTIDGRVELPRAVLVAARPLLRGAIVRAADLRLQEPGTLDGPDQAFHSIDEVVGRETTRAIPAGRTLERTWLRQPLMVRRGEMITVYARSAGVRVRTTARAGEDGGLGDLIAVESLPDRAAYFARVSGVQEVEVYARATRATGPPAADSARPAHARLARGTDHRPWAAGSQTPGRAPRLAERGLRP